MQTLKPTLRQQRILTALAERPRTLTELRMLAAPRPHDRMLGYKELWSIVDPLMAAGLVRHPGLYELCAEETAA